MPMELKPNRTTEWKPRIFDRSGGDDAALAELVQSMRPDIVDPFANQLRELFCVDNPTVAISAELESAFTVWREKRAKACEESRQGRWIYYPWLHTVVHVLEDAEFQRVRTARNKLLITPEQQAEFYNATVGIGGLSIGNSVALTIVLSGGARHIKIADFDTLDLSNTNRVRTSVAELGEKKATITARQIYEINPYADVEIFEAGLTEGNIESFMRGIDVMVDELDNMAMKYLVRTTARKLRIPVVMGADCDARAIVDIERYDRDPQPPIFHGRLGDVSYEMLKNLKKQEIGKLIGQHIGKENHTNAMLESLGNIGKTIVSWPQLGLAATLNGAALAYCVLMIVTGQKIIDDRTVIAFDALLKNSVDS